MRSFLWIPALAPSFLGVFFVFSPIRSLAQITPDSTLVGESTIVSPNQTIQNLPTDLIQGGATRGANLFHSFLEFNVNNGQRVYFDNPAGIETILSRVTGTDVSDILGTLGVNGGANLFFLNPNGIIFGSNARLDINGSFVGTTGSVVFSNYTFDATSRSPSSLLNIQVPLGLQLGQNAGAIQTAGRLVAGKDLSLVAGSLGVDGNLTAGSNLTLTGRDGIQLGSRVSALRGSGAILLDSNGDISIANLVGNELNFGSGAVAVAVQADGDGDGVGSVVMADVVNDTVQTIGRDLVITGASLTLGNVDTSFRVSGNILAVVDVDAGGLIPTEGTTGEALFTFTVNEGEIAPGTPIDVNVRFSASHTWDGDLSVSLSNPEGISATLFDRVGGDGDNFQDTVLDDEAVDRLFSATAPFNGSFYPNGSLQSLATSDPNGIWTLTVIDNVGGDSGTLYRSGEIAPWGEAIGTQLIFSTPLVLEQTAHSGNVTLTTTQGDLRIGNVNTAAKDGLAGRVRLDSAENLSVGDINASSQPSLIFTEENTDQRLEGFGGAVTLIAGNNLNVNNINTSANVSLSGTSPGGTFGDLSAYAQAGEITLTAARGAITTRNLTAKGTAEVIADVSAGIAGHLGNLRVDAQGGAIDLNAGKSITTAELNSSASADARATASANAVGEAAQGGTGGVVRDLNINATGGAIDLNAGESITTPFAFAEANSYAVIGVVGEAQGGTGGSVGDLILNATAGAIDLNAGESITTANLYSSGNTTATAVVGEAQGGNVGGLGDLTLNTTAGAIDLNAGEFITTANLYSSAYAYTYAEREAQGETVGNLTLNTTAGAIDLNAGESITTANLNSSANAYAYAHANTVVGEALGETVGNLTLNTTAGAIDLNARDSITTANLNSSASPRSIITAGGETEGQIGTVNSKTIGGNLTLNTDTLTLSGSDVTTTGGSIQINGKTLEILDTLLNTTSSQVGSGAISITASDSIQINHSQFITGVNLGSKGDGGDMTFIAPRITLGGFSILDSATFGTGQAGSVHFSATDSITLADSSIFSITNGSGNARDVSLHAGNAVSILGQSTITTASALGASGSGGNIEIKTSGTLEIEGHVQGTTANGTTANGTTANSDPNLATEVGLNLDAPNEVLQLSQFTVGTNPNVGFSSQIPFVSLTDQELQPDESKTYTIEVNATGTRAFLDIDNLLGFPVEITVLDEGGSILVDSNTFGNATEELEGQGGSEAYLPFTFREPGTYFIEVKQNTLSRENSSNLSSHFDLQVSLSDSLFVEGGLSAQTNANQTTARAGNITINANTVNLGKNATISTETSGAGAAGNIELTANQLTLNENAQLSATVTQEATTISPGGNISLNVSNLDIAGKLGIFAETASSAPAGSLQIQPQIGDPGLSIEFSNDGFISASTTASGNGGSISLSAPQSIDIGGEGKIQVITSGSGKAGTITLNAPLITLRDGVTLSGSTTGSGQGGTLELRATDSLLLNNATIEASTTQGSTGKGGSIFIDPVNTLLKDSQITVNSQGTGVGGDIDLTSNSLTLDNSEITAETRNSDGGSITLNVPRLLILRNNSIISTQAGTAEAGGNGGNITLNSNLIVGTDNSDIIANAFNGNGGNITITTQGLFGFSIENTNTPRTNLTSDITASSQFGVSNTPNVSQDLNPAHGLVLNPNVADLSGQIDRRCELAQNSNASRFTITGRGGLPPNARDSLSLQPLWTDLDLRPATTDPGETFYSQGDYPKAIDFWTQALSDPALPLAEQALLQSHLAQAYVYQGEWELATETIDRSLTHFEHLDPLLQAQLLTTQSLLLSEQGELAEALSLLEQANLLYQQQQNTFGIARTNLNQAQILQRQGSTHTAFDRLTTAQQTTQQTTQQSAQQATQQSLPNSTLQGAIALELGTLHRLQGNYTAAQTALEVSEAVFAQLPLHQTKVLLALGDNARDQFSPIQEQFNSIQERIALVPPESRGVALETRAGEVSVRRTSIQYQPLSFYQQVQQESSSDTLKLKALTQEFLTTIDFLDFHQFSDWSKATQLSLQIQDRLDNIPLSSALVYTRLNLVDGLLKLQDKAATQTTSTDIIQGLNETLKEAQSLNNKRLEALVLGKLGVVYEREEQWSKAQEFTESALQIAQATEDLDLAYRFEWQLGRLNNAQGQTENAIAAYNDSIQILNTLRTDLTTANPEVRFTFQDSINPLYRELISILLASDTVATPKPENVVQARNLIESLQLADLVNFFHADCDISNLAQVDQVDPHSAVIYPIILNDRLEVIVSLPGQSLKHYASPLKESQLLRIVTLMQQELSTSTGSNRYLPLAKRLYDAIVRPLEPDLTEYHIENLVFVLDGSMRSLPMSVLHDGSQFLVEKYAIALTPGLQVFKPEALEGTQLNVLVGGVTDARQGFDALPNVQTEISAIQQKTRSEVLLNNAFSEQNLAQALESKPFPVVHLATHGEFGSRIEETFLLTWDDRISVNGLSTLLQQRNNNKAIELLILSACRTAVGDDRAALGLAGIAVRSGARSTLASLWYINDEATSHLMETLYQGLSQPEITKAEAVRQAQLSLLKSDRYFHPYYWAPFVLVGNWL